LIRTTFGLGFRRENSPPTVFAGEYQVFEGGKKAFRLNLSSDGRASKSHAPKVKGAWIGNEQQVMVVWSDGWRDHLVTEKKSLMKRAFGPGDSFSGEPTNTGILERIGGPQ
jgi:hypothetical protein